MKKFFVVDSDLQVFICRTISWPWTVTSCSLGLVAWLSAQSQEIVWCYETDCETPEPGKLFPLSSAYAKLSKANRMLAVAWPDLRAVFYSLYTSLNCQAYILRQTTGCSQVTCNHCLLLKFSQALIEIKKKESLLGVIYRTTLITKYDD